MIAALFVDKNSIYKTIPDVDCFDVDRDARTFTGDIPVIAHPPCRLWGRMYKFSTADESEKELARFAVDVIRKNGGILEHPAYSKLWKDKNLPLPGRGIDEHGGFTVDIDQHFFGYPAQKHTWLYICGINPKDLPAIELNYNAITHCIDSNMRQKGKKQRLSYIPKSKRSSTTERLALWLIKVATMTQKVTE